MNLYLKERVDEAASIHFSSAGDKIEQVQDGIMRNLPITEIARDSGRVGSRLAREGQPDRIRALERVNNVADFQDVCVVKKILRMSDSICRIEMASAFGGTVFATGFLVGAGILITNHHVFENPDAAAGATIRFRYELDEWSRPSKDISFQLRPDLLFVTSDIARRSDMPFSGLDFTLVAVAPVADDGKTSIADISPVRLDGGAGKVLEGENCVIVQHPQGDYKKIVLRDIRMLTLTDDFLVYESDTRPGSSGSMVIGLGTGEVVALHHASVPRKDAAGNWLRKDGSIAQDTDPDDEIDWIGNEGIRISSILKAVAGMDFPQSMENYRAMLLSMHTMSQNGNATNGSFSSFSPVNSGAGIAVQKSATEDMPKNTTTTVANPVAPGTSAQPVQYFEIILADDPLMQASWGRQMATVIPSFRSSERVFPLSTDPRLRRHFYVGADAKGHPWEQAAEIEALPMVERCLPDLPIPTHADTDMLLKGDRTSEDFFMESKSDEDNWKKFSDTWDKKMKPEWRQKLADEFGEPGGMLTKGFRYWSRIAVDMSDAVITDELAAGLKQLSLVQLDTGYSNHSKNIGGYDFTRDYNVVDDNKNDAIDPDANHSMDPEIDHVLKYPGHGTRTASLVIGGKLSPDPKNCSGNHGILTKGGRPLVQLWPYRVSKSVILFGRGKDLWDAVQHAAQGTKPDVMFMCMGIYPRPILDDLAKEVYDEGIIWVCAAGNNVKVVVAPAMAPGTIAVAAINPSNNRWAGSSNGVEVDISAPGEDVYVPVAYHDERGESMRYGDGTSYATPHVAAAAMLWLAKHRDDLRQYKLPWQKVEAFRYCLKESASPFATPLDGFGAGVLNIPDLLNVTLPEASKLRYAYEGVTFRKWDLGIIESAERIFQSLGRTLFGPESAVSLPLTERGRIALAAITGRTALSAEEAAPDMLTEDQKIAFLRYYFGHQYINAASQPTILH